MDHVIFYVCLHLCPHMYKQRYLCHFFLNVVLPQFVRIIMFIELGNFHSTLLIMIKSLILFSYPLCALTNIELHVDMTISVPTCVTEISPPK